MFCIFAVIDNVSRSNTLFMKLEFDIARRLSSRRYGARAGVMERVATVATAVSVAVVVVTLSVVVGFKRDLNDLLTGATSDIVVTSPQSAGMVSSVGVERHEALERCFDDSRIAHISTYTAKEGVIKSDENIVGVLLKGVDRDCDMTLYADHMVEGTLPRLDAEPRAKDVILSEIVARKMDARVDDRMEMIFIDTEGGILRDRFRISGIYRTGVEMIDEGFVLTDIRNVSRLYDGDESVVTGYELRLKRGVDKLAFQEELNEKFVDLYYEEGIDVEAFTLGDIFPLVYFWLSTHDVNAMVIIIIMAIVALLNMTTALLIIVLERQRMIGQLRSLGMKRRSVVELFLFRALFIVGRGLAWGTLLGVVLCGIQHLWAVVPLPSEGYMLSAVPAAMCWGWWALSLVVAVVVALLVMLLPAAYAARISPSETMRYE